MKKIYMPIAAILIATSLQGCGGVVDVDVDGLASALANNLEYDETLTEVSDEITKKRFGLDSTMVEDCAAYAGTRAVADEVAVFKTSDTETVNDKVREHIESQIKAYKDYKPEEVQKLDRFILYTYNDTVIYCVGGDENSAMEIIVDYTTK